MAESPQANSEQGEKKVATVKGKLTDKNGQPIAEATVTLATPEADLRYVYRLGAETMLKRTKTDSSGEYELEVPVTGQTTSASIDFSKPGFKRLVGTPMSVGDPNRIDLSVGKTAIFDAQLSPAWYVAGTVVNTSGDPMPETLVHASLRGKTFSAGVAWVETDIDGKFEIFGYQDELFELFSGGDKDSKDSLTADLGFHKRGFIDGHMESIHLLPKSERSNLKFVLKEGLTYEGQLLTPEGEPAAGRLVSFQNEDSYQYNGVYCDDDGRFRMIGLSPGKHSVTVRDVPHSSSLKTELQIERSEDQKTLKLSKVTAAIPDVIEFAGLKIGNVTPEIKEAYFIPSSVNGAIVLDQGPNLESFKIGKLAPGNVLYMVGNERVDGVEGFIHTLLAESLKPTVPLGKPGNTTAFALPEGGMAVRVVYTFADENSSGTSTRYINLTTAQIDELGELSAKLKSKR